MKDKIVVVTGSTSGIGLGIASKFAKNGAKLVINGFASENLVHIVLLLKSCYMIRDYLMNFII